MLPNGNLLFATFLATLLFSLLTLLIANWFRSLRSYTVDKVIETIHRYRKFHAELKDLVKQGRKFTQCNNEPYTTEVRKHLIVQKRSIDNMLLSSDELRLVLHEIPTCPDNIILAIGKAIIVWPFQWFALKRKVEKFYLDLEDHKYDITELSRSFIHLQELPWEISIRVQELHKVNLKTRNILQYLYKNHVVGAKFKDSVKHYKWLIGEYQKIPYEFRDGNKITILGLNDNLTPTINTFEIIQKINHPADIFLLKVRQWKSMYDDNVKARDRLLLLLSEVPKLFNEMPTGIDTSKERGGWEDLDNETKALQNVQRQPTIEALESNTKQTFEVITKTEKLSDILVRSQANFRKLIQQFSQVDEKLTRLSKSFYEQTTRKDYPIEWSVTKLKIEEIEDSLSKLGTIETRRTTDEIETSIVILDQINCNLSKIEEISSCIESLSEDLRRTWQECIVILHAKWLPSVEILAKDVGRYSKLNWAPDDNIEELYIDAINLFSLAKSTLPTENYVALPEQEVEAMLSKSKKLLDDLLVMEARKQRIYSILINIQRQERNAIKIVEKLIPVLDTIMPEITLEEVPLDAAKHLVSLASIGNTLNEELAESKIGVISNKAERIGDWEQDVYQAVKSLLLTLQNEIDQKQNQISDWLKRMETYARQVIDPAVERVQQYQYVNVYSYDVESVYKIDFTQSCQQLIDFAQKYKEIRYCSGEFESIILQPLEEEYSEVMRRKDDAENLFRRTAKVFKRSWPPVDEHLDLNENKAELATAEELLKTIRRHKQTVYNLINDYTNLKLRYLDIYGDIQNKLSSDKHFQNRFRSIEEDAQKRLREMVGRHFGASSEDSGNYRLKDFLRQGTALLDVIKSEYEGGRYSAYDVEIAMKELFRNHTTYIDQSQNIRIHNITLSDGSQCDIKQSM